MSEPEDFLSRWTRLKREAARAEEHAPPTDEARDDAEHDAPKGQGVTRAHTASSAPVVDLSALPAIESITAATDIRAFLAPGVPADLTRAALRRAWVVDPTIRDFIGIAENQWDFTNPDTIPGFGSLGSLDDVRRLVARVVGKLSGDPDAGPSDTKDSLDAAASNDFVSSGQSGDGLTAGPVLAGLTEPAPSGDAAGVVRRNVTVAATQQDKPHDEARPPSKGRAVRGHGSALPK